MAKEDDLKIVELKVSVNCCQGCRRQVMKALSTVKGVLKTEIHPTLPKVTVYGSVDAQTLIKKLAKRGKTAGLWPSTETHKLSKDSSTDETKPSSNLEKDIGIDNSTTVRTFRDEEKYSSNENISYVNEDRIKDINGANSSETSTPDAQVLVTQVPPNMASSMMASHARVFYPMEPSSTAPLVYYTVNPHYASNYVQEGGHYPYQVPVYHHHPPPAPPPAPSPAVMQYQTLGFSDYFNDDNTVGCQVM
ncbi:hypothetical protein J5N97_007053 [Dioscorea zingiberensis]|uniref:HMA domain-containing protein n=1 Tax=Dioscorea zingiberensis TaxID=325984 RepID=A0A9D5HUN8_9LILI|nr:hypothetical protein J5N97_007053 [Dioscorea zingiberensis]